MALTTEQVNGASAALTARANTVINSLEDQKSILGGWSGNNDTVEQTQGAIRMIRDNQLPGWTQNGLDLANQGDEANPDKVKGWVDLGQTFADAMSKIDGYGQDATLQSVVIATVKQTGKDIGDKVLPALSFGFGAVAALALIGVAVYIMVLKR